MDEEIRISRWLDANPVIYKEVRGRMRGSRALLVLTLYLALLSVSIILVLAVFQAQQSAFSSVDDRQMVGKAIFAMITWLELIGICFIAPALTAGAISSERERQTYELLRTTLLPAKSLVLGKFTAAVSFLLLLIVAAVPLQGLSLWFGGVAIEEVLLGTLLLVVTALTFCAEGMLFSALTKRTLISTVLAYAFALLTVFGLPFLLIFVTMLFNAANPTALNNLSPQSQATLLVIGWLLVSANPLTAAAASEAILLQEGSIFSMNFPLGGGLSVTLPSPWIPYTVLSLLFCLFLLWGSVRLVHRPER